jgi:hypothetical protein
MRRYLNLPWILVGLVVATAVGYFGWRFHDPAFRDAAFANLLATILGILVGAPIALEINRRGEESTRIRDSADRIAEQKRRLRSLYWRLSEELSVNKQRVDRLQEGLAQTESSRTDHWAWMITISDAFSFDAFHDLTRSGLKREFPWDLQDAVDTAYSLLKGTADRVREAAAAHEFHHGYQGQPARANAQLDFVRGLARDARRRAEEGLVFFQRYRDLFPPPQANQ